MMWKEDALLLIYVALGGALGSVARYLVAAALKGVWSNHFPWEMVFVNTFGCILVGFFAAFLYTKFPHPRWAMLLYWGFIGGFTAFSSFIKEGLHFFLHGDHLMGFCTCCSRTPWAFWRPVCLSGWGKLFLKG